jgi:nitrous oxide reductase accessory protein NosL
MFVAKYPDWVASLRFEDGKVFHFDGAKDLFKFLLNLPRYAPGRSREQIQDILVTDYYEVERIPAREAFFVLGSDVDGPMGSEFIPHRTAEDATSFSTDHRGTRVVRFDEVDQALVNEVDRGHP